MTEGTVARLRFDDRDALDALAARGFSPWGKAFRISAESVEGFARATGTVAANGTIPGFLILSLLPRIMPQPNWLIEGHTGALNMGCPVLRFPVSVRVGACLQGRARPVSARSHPRGCIVTFEYEAREEGRETPCMLATIELLYIGGPA